MSQLAFCQKPTSTSEVNVTLVRGVLFDVAKLFKVPLDRVSRHGQDIVTFQSAGRWASTTLALAVQNNILIVVDKVEISCNHRNHSGIWYDINGVAQRY